VSTASTVQAHPLRSRVARVGILMLILLLVLAALIGFLLQPQRASEFLLDRVGTSLGLRITASGQASYRLRGTPQLVLHDVVMQNPGDPTPILRADRVFVAVPWSTLRARGADLKMQRIELDGPVLDLPALQRWQATRPPSETRIPTLTNGLGVTRGRIDNDAWRIDGISVHLPSLEPGKPVQAHLQGRYVAQPTTLPFDLHVALTTPANAAGLTVAGKVTLTGVGWSLPAQVHLSGPVHWGGGEISMLPARFGLSGRYISAKSKLPLLLGAAGPLHFKASVWALQPATLVLHGGGMIPDASANGALALGRRMVLHLKGRIAAWPAQWPALPPPLSASTSPMTFSLDYAGQLNFSDVVSLGLHRDASLFDARFKLTAILDWLDTGTAGSPLPPLAGSLQTPRVKIAGATLEGVEIEFQDDAAPAPR
jgi:hypothetical protein